MTTPDPLAILRARFLARAADDLAWLRVQGGGPSDELLARTHKLAGAGGTFGFQEVSEAAMQVEQDIHDGAPLDLTALIAALEALPPP
jgi:HPt (histidine-containing phosphotransfer) domain-containing protein